jgi:hypothetical protein
MTDQKESIQDWPIWVDMSKRIISFQEVEGFKKLIFPTREEMLQFAIDRSSIGFSIQ